MRVGIGHDTHRFRDDHDPRQGASSSSSSSIRLGGVTIPHERSLLGHSDADVLLHAITDALLGAAGRGDIGDLFPDTSDENKGRDSAEFLVAARDLVRQDGWKIVNLDLIVFAQTPKLSPYKEKIQNRIAGILEIPPENVNVKAKTGEGIGIIGRKEAISAEAIVLLE